MADIKIRHTEKHGDYSREINIEVTGIEYAADVLVKEILENLDYPKSEGVQIDGN